MATEIKIFGDLKHVTTLAAADKIMVGTTDGSLSYILASEMQQAQVTKEIVSQRVDESLPEGTSIALLDDDAEPGAPPAGGGGAEQGIDYTDLAEHIVPGEFWFGTDGVTKKQVYRRTFKGTLPENIDQAECYVLDDTIETAATLPGSNVSTIPPCALTYNRKDMSPSSFIFWQVASGVIVLCPTADGHQLLGAPYCIMLKYTKL